MKVKYKVLHVAAEADGFVDNQAGLNSALESRLNELAREGWRFEAKVAGPINPTTQKYELDVILVHEDGGKSQVYLTD